MNDARQNLNDRESVAVRRGRLAAAIMRPEPGMPDTLRIPEATNETAARFVAKLAATDDGHWVWTASTTEGGYGRFSIAGKAFLAHRVAWTWRNCRQIPQGLTIDHVCRVRACTRPDDLDAVTHRENTLRGNTVTAANASRERCPRGHVLEGINLRAAGLRIGQRSCRICAVARVRALNALSLGHPDRGRVARAAVERLMGDETPESLWLVPAPIHLRLGLVAGAEMSAGKQLELVGMGSTVSMPRGVVA
jgi:hypothetical protein